MVAKNTVRRYVVNHAVNFVKLKESSNPIFFRKDLFWFIHAHMFWDTIWFKYHDAGMEEEECIDSNIFNTKFHTVLGTDRISGIFHIRYPAGYKIQLPVMRIFCLPVTWIFDQNTVYFRISGQIFCIQTDLRPDIRCPKGLHQDQISCRIDIRVFLTQYLTLFLKVWSAMKVCFPY